jgi:predicted nucleic acid-binding protein
MKPRVYIETSVISYLVSRPTLDVITAGHQATTLQWWEQQRSRFELVISQFVVDEASEGDPVAAEKRVAALSGISVLPISEPQIIVLAQALLKAGALPQKAKLDALHIAVCAVTGVDILLTWNFKHIVLQMAQRCGKSNMCAMKTASNARNF